jgi:hypothetical protein
MGVLGAPEVTIAGGQQHQAHIAIGLASEPAL